MWRQWWHRLQGFRLPEGSLPARIVNALLDIGLRDRALTLAGQAFIALVPLLIVLATIASSSDALAVADWLIERFDLTGAPAEAVVALFDKPPSATGGVGIVSVLMLLVSLSSFAGSIQHTFEEAWGLPSQGRRGRLAGLAGAGVLLCAVGGVGYVAGLVDAMTHSWLLTGTVKLLVAIAAWWLLARLLLAGRVAWMVLLPGAVVSAAGHLLVSWGSAVWVPLLMARNAERYGVIGIAIALVSWLVILAFLIVCNAVLGAQLGPTLAARLGGEDGVGGLGRISR